MFVNGRRSHNEINRFAHALLPEHQPDLTAARAKVLPNSWSLDECRTLFPEKHLRQVLEKKSVGNQPVCTDRRRCPEASLEDARYRRKESLHRLKLRQVRDQGPAEGGEIDDK
jgi:hypothetical protein